MSLSAKAKSIKSICRKIQDRSATLATYKLCICESSDDRDLAIKDNDGIAKSPISVLIIVNVNGCGNES